MSKRLKILLISMAIIMLFASGYGLSAFLYTYKESRACMAPLVNGPFLLPEHKPVRATPLTITDYPHPPFGWDKKADLNFVTPDHQLNFHHVRQKNGYPEFWFSRVGSGKTLLYSVIFKENLDVTKFELPRRTIPGFNQGKVYAIAIDEFSSQVSIYRLNDETIQFDMIIKETGIQADLILDIAFGERDIIWILAYSYGRGHERAIYAVSLTTNNVVKHVSENSMIIEIETDSTGSLFYTAYSAEPDKGTKIVHVMDGSEKIITTYTPPMEAYFMVPTHLLVSDDDQLWLGNVFWNPKAGYLYDLRVVIPPPLFVNKNMRYGIVVESPSPQEVTEDGRVWFKSDRGLTWHQPETGEWCMFTTADSNIVKDDEGNLWIIYNNALYMLPAEETKAKG